MKFVVIGALGFSIITLPANIFNVALLLNDCMQDVIIGSQFNRNCVIRYCQITLFIYRQKLLFSHMKGIHLIGPRREKTFL